MHVPAAVRERVERELDRSGEPARIVSATPVAGGCINQGVRLTTDGGRDFFLKHNRSAPPGMFAAEADGLRALRAAALAIDTDVRPAVPEPVAFDEDGEGPAWLLLEWIEPGRASPDVDERLGRGLALLHAARPEGLEAGLGPASEGGSAVGGGSGRGSVDDGAFGWPTDNWIGSLPQTNDPDASWAAFWRDRRIVPQLEAARRSEYLDDPVMDRLVDVIEPALADVDRPALLHGDLWSGNAYATADGRGALVDPAVYLGDGEVDLAMTELFGGFGPRFYAAYREARGVTEAYDEVRRSLYQLYYLLVHVNLFGGGYASSSRAAAATVVAALG